MSEATRCRVSGTRVSGLEFIDLWEPIKMVYHVLPQGPGATTTEARTDSGLNV